MSHQRACAIEHGFNACTCIPFHMSATGDPFGPALCGYTPADGAGIWITTVEADLNCVVCLDLKRGAA